MNTSFEMDQDRGRRPDKPRISIALHVAAYLVFVSGVVGLNSCIRETNLVLIAAVGAGVGHVVSIAFRRLGRSVRLVELVSIALCIVLAYRMLSANHPDDWLIPASILDPELRLAMLLLWLEVLRSFTLMNDDALVFSAVPAATLLALTANINVNPDMIAYFMLFIASTCFLLIHKNSLASGCDGNRRHITEQLRAATSLALLAVLAGAIMLVPLRIAATGTVHVVTPELLKMRAQFGLPMYSESDSIRIAQGPIELSDETDMIVRVKTNSHDALLRDWYWRGRVYDYYTGRGWESTSQYSRADQSLIGDEEGFRESMLEPRYPNTLRVYQQIETFFGRDWNIYAAGEPVLMVTPLSGFSVDGHNCWRRVVSDIFLNSYEIVSEAPDATPEQLASAGSDYPYGIRKMYLQTAVGTVRTAELARTITEGLANPYEKARAIEAHLSSRYTYNLKAGPTPRGVDAVEHFLFTSRNGYCDVFASAMVIMCREVGIPARFATGFASGVYDADIGAYRIRNSDRHAWAEVFFPEYGWIAFDPVAPIGDHGYGLIAAFRQVLGRFWRGMISSELTPVVLLMLLTILLFSGAGIWRRNRDIETAIARRLAWYRHNDPVRRTTVRDYNNLCREIVRAGLPPRGNLAAGEYRDLLLSMMEPSSESARLISEFTRQFEEVRYGDRTPSPELRRSLRARRLRLRRALRAS